MRSGLWAQTAALPLRVFIGYDPLEVSAYHVLAHSINKHASRPVQITAVALTQLEREMWRERDPKQSTEFAFSRFLVPCLSDYQGYSLFMDCDMLLRTDISRLFAVADHHKAVMCCKHEYTPKTDTKMEGVQQTAYPKKNWSSVMLFNNARCRALTPGYVNSASGLDLHTFKWLQDDSEIGELPLRWNWLVGEYPYNPDAHIAHFTLGGPWLDESVACDYSQEWFQALEEVLDRTPAATALVRGLRNKRLTA